MLPQDKGGVVDPTLKVYGTTNIRVVDLSIIPVHIAAHTQGKCSARFALLYKTNLRSLSVAVVYGIAEYGELFCARSLGIFLNLKSRSIGDYYRIRAQITVSTRSRAANALDVFV